MKYQKMINLLENTPNYPNLGQKRELNLNFEC